MGNAINPWSPETPEFSAVMGQMAFANAAKKYFTDQYQQLRTKAEGMLLQLQESMDVDRIALKIGDSKVGSATLTQRGVTITNEEMFGEFAANTDFDGRPAAQRDLTITLSGISEQGIKDVLDALNNGTSCEYRSFSAKPSYRIRKDFRDALIPYEGRVMTPDGEIVPGAVPSTSTIRVMGCKPDDVKDALNRARLNPTVNELLAGEGE